MFKVGRHYPHAWQLLPLLGFKAGGHLPPEGFEPRVVQGVTFKCLPAIPGKRKHRIFYQCECQKWVPYGRASQHKCHSGRKRGRIGDWDKPVEGTIFDRRP